MHQDPHTNKLGPIGTPADAQRVSLTDQLDRIETLEDTVLGPGPGANPVGQDPSGLALGSLDLRGVRAMEA